MNIYNRFMTFHVHIFICYYHILILAICKYSVKFGHINLDIHIHIKLIWILQTQSNNIKHHNASKVAIGWQGAESYKLSVHDMDVGCSLDLFVYNAFFRKCNTSLDRSFHAVDLLLTVLLPSYLLI